MILIAIFRSILFIPHFTMTRKEHTTETMVAKEESSTEPVVFACH